MGSKYASLGALKTDLELHRRDLDMEMMLVEENIREFEGDPIYLCDENIEFVPFFAHFLC